MATPPPHWRTLGALCRERDWSKRRLLHELRSGLPYRTLPPGHVIDWSHPEVESTLDIDASEVRLILGLLPVEDVAFDYRLVGVEVLPPTDEAPEQSTDKAPLPTAPKEPRSWGLIRQIAAELWPHGYEHVGTGEIMKAVGLVLTD